MDITAETRMALGLPTPRVSRELDKNLEERIAELEDKVDALIWLHDEQEWHRKKAAAQQLLSHPEVRERLEALIMARMSGDGTEP